MLTIIIDFQEERAGRRKGAVAVRERCLSGKIYDVVLRASPKTDRGVCRSHLLLPCKKDLLCQEHGEEHLWLSTSLLKHHGGKTYSWRKT